MEKVARLETLKKQSALMCQCRSMGSSPALNSPLLTPRSYKRRIVSIAVTDPRWKDASSLDLLRRAVALVAGQGFEIGNLDVTVVLEKPKIKDHIDAMRAAVAAAIGVDAARVSIKGKTNEGVDAIGRGEAIAAHAVVLIRAV